MGKHRKIRKRGGHRRDLERVNPNAAGIDVGASAHWAAVDSSLCDEPVRSFGTYTDDLHKLADWLLSHGVTTVAMESTGVFWIPLYEVLRDRGLEVVLVDARATKQVRGRKSDVSDCQWIQQLHSYGLLKAAFIPDASITALRSYMRQRERWVDDAARAIQHMQQAMELMNVKLMEVVRDITGVTGMTIIDSILAGERDPRVLASHRDPRCKRDEEEIARALRGTWHEEHLFALEQARHHYRYLGERIQACDQRIDALLPRNASDTPIDPPPMTAGPPKRSLGKHPFGFDAHGYCLQLAGVDLTTIDGVGIHTAMTVVAELGVDMSPWRNERAFGSWLGIAPNTRKSGARTLSSRTLPNANRAATAFRLAARALSNSKSALGAYYRRLRARIGAPKAITATAYKLARIFYRMLSTKSPYHDVGQDAYDRRFRARRLRSVTRMARDLGYKLVPTPSGC